VGGLLYVLIFALGFTLFAFPSVRTTGIAAIQTIEASQAHLRTICALELILFSLDVPLAVILYVLLRDVDRNLALLSAFFRAANAFFGCISVLGRIAVLLLFGNAGYRTAFNTHQLQALGSIFLTLHQNAQDIGLLFFGIHCILIGVLIWRSKYFPTFIGALLPIAGVAYLFVSFSPIIDPAFDARIPFAIFLPGFLAEVSLCLWLLIWGFGGQRLMQRRAVLD
jgi:hypothetical protein